MKEIPTALIEKAIAADEQIINISDIVWDTFDEDTNEAPPADDLGLPNGAYDTFDTFGMSSDEIEDMVNDYLSDRYGYLVETYSYQIINPRNLYAKFE